MSIITSALRLLTIGTLAVSTSCNRASAPVTTTPTTDNSAALPEVRIYKTSGDFVSNVPVTLTDDRKAILSYPAPTDLNDTSLPIALDDGYLLDRRGISQNTVFTSYTYADYSRLPEAPSPERLMNSVIPGAVVTEIVALPVTWSSSSVTEITKLCNGYINDGLAGCRVIYKAPILKLD